MKVRDIVPGDMLVFKAVSALHIVVAKEVLERQVRGVKVIRITALDRQGISSQTFYDDQCVKTVR